MESALLNLFWRGTFNQTDWTSIDWNLLLEIARKNHILIRVGNLLQQKGGSPPRFFLDAIHQERKRIDIVCELIGKINDLCLIHKIPLLMPTVLQHYPDMGADVDLLVPDDSRLIDSLLPKEFPAKLLPKSFFNFISTESSFSMPSPYPSIEIRHGMLGLTGEHRFFTTLLFKNARITSFYGFDISIPSDEDHILLQTIQRLYGRFYLRISDVVSTSVLLESNNLDWDYIVGTARKLGIVDGLSCYLVFINKIYEDVCSRSLLPSHLNSALVMGDNHLSFKRLYYKYPLLKVTMKIYLSKIAHDVRMAHLGSAVRLCLVPLVVLAYLIRNLRGRKSRYFE